MQKFVKTLLLMILATKAGFRPPLSSFSPWAEYRCVSVEVRLRAQQQVWVGWTWASSRTSELPFLKATVNSTRKPAPPFLPTAPCLRLKRCRRTTETFHRVSTKWSESHNLRKISFSEGDSCWPRGDASVSGTVRCSVSVCCGCQHAAGLHPPA